MDGFGDNFDDTEVDPAAEFLAREQDQLAGLEDELKPAVTPVVNGGTHLAANESTGSFEMINSLGQNDGGFDIPLSKDENGVPEEQEFNTDTLVEELAPSPSPIKQVREEPEKIKKWREEQKMSLEEKDKNEEKKKEEWRNAAKKELDEWYRHHEELIAKTKAANRESAKNAEKQFVAEGVDSVVELSRRRPETGFLVRDSIRAVSGRFNDDGSISVDGARTVVEGETLRVEGKVLPNGCKSRYLRCTDHQGRTVLLGLDQRGRFSTLAREDSIGGVHTVRDLLNKRLPLTVRLVHGPPPRGLKNPSQFIPELRLLTSVEEEHVFALPLQKDTGVVIPLPLAAPLKIQKTRNEDRLRSLREYQRLLERCGRLVDEVVDRAYALEGKLGDTKRAPVACFIRRSPPPSDHIDDENRIPGGDDYDEIDRLYDYVRGFPPQPRNKPDPPPVETIPGKKPYVKNNRSQKPRQKTTGGSPLFDIRYKSLSDLQQDSSGDSAKLPEKKTKRLTSRPRSLTNLVWEQRKPARIGTLYL